MSRGYAAALAGGLVALACFAGSASAIPGPTIGAVYPTPHSLVVGTGAVRVTPSVTVVAPRGTDPGALGIVKETLSSTGAAVWVVRRAPAGRRLTVLIGADQRVERSLHIGDSSKLPPGGYVLASGLVGDTPVIMLDGVDPAGEFYAAQTLRQLVADRLAWPAFAIRDWPSFASRGIVEGFYGTYWSPTERLAMLDFLARHKLNLDMYLPKDDPYVRNAWKTPLPPGQLASLRSYAAKAARDHVTFNYGLSPGDSICYSSTSDQAALVAKYLSLTRVGVHSFTLALDDIDVTRPLCAADVAKYGTGPTALAQAQADTVNAVADALAKKGSTLTLVPTEYAGLAATPYKQTLAALVHPGLVIQWTGPYGVSLSVNRNELAAARRLYAHPLLIWDNYFVTDLLPGYLVLGAYDGRSAALASLTQGIAIDPMAQAEASKLGLFTAADFEWNASRYDAVRSWAASLNEFTNADPVASSALRAFAAANYGSPAATTQSPTLVAAMTAFWKSWNAGDPNAAAQLAPAFARLRDAPAIIRGRLRNQEFLNETAPWLDATQLWGTAALAALDLMVARQRGDTDRATTDEATARDARSQATLMNLPGTQASIRVAGGALAEFVHYALRGYGP